MKSSEELKMMSVVDAVHEYLDTTNADDLIEVVLEGFVESLIYCPLSGNAKRLDLESDVSELSASDVFNFFVFWGQGLAKTDDYYKKAPEVLRGFFDYIQEFSDFNNFRIKEIGKIIDSKKNEVRLESMENALERNYSKTRFMQEGMGNVVSLSSYRRPRIKLRGSMEVVNQGEEGVTLKSHYGEEIGPVSFSKDVLKCLKTGDILDLSIGKYGDTWKVLECFPC